VIIPISLTRKRASLEIFYNKLLDAKPATVVTGRLRHFNCACCGESFATCLWNVKFCAKPECQERKRELAHGKKGKYDKRRSAQGRTR